MDGDARPREEARGKTREANLAAKRAQDRAKDDRIAELEAELTAKKTPDLRIV
jgi:hypothetical protein